MTLLDSTTLTSELAETVRGKLQNAPAPLKLAEVVKGLPKPRTMKPITFRNEIQAILDEQVRLGQVFCCPSGKNDELRYWSRDEKYFLREKALELASTPLAHAALKTKLKSEVKKVEASFVEAVIAELIGEGKLFEHPAKTARGKSSIGAAPPPPPLPPLAQPKHAKTLNKLIADCQKLLAASKVSLQELLQTMQTRLQPSPDAETSDAVVEPAPSPDVIVPPPPGAELDEVILKALAQAPVLSLAELRAGMPAEYRGSAFDDTVLRLADEQQVILSQDAVPAHFSTAEQSQYVRDGEALFTTIAKWS